MPASQIPQVAVAGTDGTLLAVGSGGTLTVGGTVVATAPGSGIMWNAAAVSAAGTSTFALTTTFNNFIIFGNVSAATTLTVQVYDPVIGGTYYDSSVTVVLAGAGNFSIDCRPVVGANRVRLKSSAAATITAVLTGN